MDGVEGWEYAVYSCNVCWCIVAMTCAGFHAPV